MMFPVSLFLHLILLMISTITLAQEAKTSLKPPLHGKHWVAISGKPLAASAGAQLFVQGGNAVDAACGMLAAAATIWDTLGWGGETQALIYNPNDRKVYAINALGVAPSGATPEKYRQLGYDYPPEYGPLAAVTPGTPGGLLVMLAEFGTMSLAQVLAPAMDLAEGFPIEENLVNQIRRYQPFLEQWQTSTSVFLPHRIELGVPPWPVPGELFRQENLLKTFQKLVEAERQALQSGANRKEAIMAAYERFYRGDIAEELASAVQADGGLITMQDLANYQVYIEDPVKVTYKDYTVYKLNTWVQGPVLLQMLNLLEPYDLKALGYNSAEYIHLLYQVMNLSFADRDFYYGDPYFVPEEPLKGLLSKDYAALRRTLIDMEFNDPNVRPGDPYPFQGESNPFVELLQKWKIRQPEVKDEIVTIPTGRTRDEAFHAGTTTIQSADAEGWVVSMTPSGGWVPAYIAGSTGVGLSQRMQSFVMEQGHNPYNLMQPGKRPRATLTPSIALQGDQPVLSFAVQGGDTQEQNLLQFFLNVVEFGMDVQQATEAANFNSYQLHSSFIPTVSEPGRIILRTDTPKEVLYSLSQKGYRIELEQLSSGPINAIYRDVKHGTLMGGSSNYGDDYGLAW